MNPRTLAAIGLPFLALTAGDAGAFVLSGGRWVAPSQPISFRFAEAPDEACISGDDERLEVRDAIEAWSSLSGVRLAFFEAQPTSACGLQIDGESTISFDDCLNQCTDNCIAVTSTVAWGNGGDPTWAESTELSSLTEADVTFSATFPFGRSAAIAAGCETDDCGPGDAFDLKSVATHEIGHVIGLGHSQEPDATMRSWIPTCDGSQASLASDDVAGARFLYAEEQIPFGFRDLEGGEIRLTIFNAGNLGYSGSRGATPGQFGAGFEYPPGTPNLYEAGLMLGTGSSDPVSSDARRSAPLGQDNDFRPLGPVISQRPGSAGDHTVTAVFHDGGAEPPYGLTVIATAHAWEGPPRDTFVIVCYRILNTSGAAIEGLRVGLYLDWDLGGHVTTNTISAFTDIAVVSDNAASHLIGVTALNPEGVRTIRALRKQDVFTEATTAQYLFDGFSDTDEFRSDVALVIATGDFDIPPSGVAEATFAIVVAQNQLQLLTRTESARNAYSLEDVCAPPPVAAGSGTPAPARLGPAVPNPLAAGTRITFALERPGMVYLTVSDAAGRRVRTLVAGHFPGGGHAVAWDGRDDRGRLVASGVYFTALRAGGVRASRRIVLAR